MHFHAVQTFQCIVKSKTLILMSAFYTIFCFLIVKKLCSNLLYKMSILFTICFYWFLVATMSVAAGCKDINVDNLLLSVWKKVYLVRTAWRQWKAGQTAAWLPLHFPPAQWPVSFPSCGRRRWAEAPWSVRLQSGTSSHTSCWSGSVWEEGQKWQKRKWKHKTRSKRQDRQGTERCGGFDVWCIFITLFLL